MQAVKDQDVLNVLRRMTFKGECAYLPPNLERKLYMRTNKVLAALGGNWKGGKTSAHVFPGDAKDILAEVVGTGEYLDVQKDQAYFPTPDQLVLEMLAMAKLRPGQIVLEPEAGRGAIVRRLVEAKCQVYAVEINPDYKIDLLKAGAHDVVIMDFLTLKPEPIFPTVIMNPPFGIGGQSDLAHILHAWEFLTPGGILVSVTSPSWTFRTNKASLEFAKFVEAHGKFRENLATFDDTAVKTVTVVLRKPS